MMHDYDYWPDEDMSEFYMRGHRCYQVRGYSFYMDGTPIPDDPADERPCVKCGQPPTPEGHDACLGHIPGVYSACCGHGIENGLIYWQPGGQAGAFDGEPEAEVEAVMYRTRICWPQRKRRKPVL